MKSQSKHLSTSFQLSLIVILIAGILYQAPVIQSQAANPPAPVLLITNTAATTKYGPFLGEILRTEGLNNFDSLDISQVTSAILAQYELAILGQTALNTTQASSLRSYVNGGGRLIAMRPDLQIADVFGLGVSGGPQNNGYVKIINNAAFDGQNPGSGIAPDSMQIHGVTDKYTLAGGAVMLAQLYSDANTTMPYPAVSGNIYGSGRAVAFNYDLPANISLTRQGNPANANVDSDHDGILRTIDLFQSSTGGAPWVDLNKVQVPQTDEQQRFFARLVRQLQLKPVPQFWYFPGNIKTMLILTGDAHGNPTSYYQNEINSLNTYGAKITLYMSIAGEPTNASVQTWRSQGHEFGVHPYAYKPDSYPPYNVTNLSQGYNAMDTWWNITFSSPKSRTVRDHQIAWLGYTDVIDIQAAHNIAMDTDFYAWGNWLKKADNTWAHGYITGSGLPMKFVKLDGTITSVYQQATHLIDEQWFVGETNEVLTAAQAFTVTKNLIDASQAGFYSALMTQNHVDYYGNGDPKVWMEQTMAYAQSLGIPMWNADKWLNFTETRHDANYSNTTWDAASGVLTFNLNANALSGIQLTNMLPMNYGGKTLSSVVANGVPVTFQQATIKGVPMGLITLASGTYTFQAQYGPGVPPTLTPTPTSTSIPTSTLTPTATSIFTATPTSTQIPGTPTFTPIPPTATPTNLATATSTPFVPSATPTPSQGTGTITYTSFIDFAQACSVINQTHVSDMGGGAVALAAAFADDFVGSSLNGQLWTWGNWSTGTFTPVLSNSILGVHAVGGAWVHSVPTYTHGTIEALAEFGNGAYEHIGFGSDSFTGNRYILFSTFNGNGHLYARVNNNVSEQNIDLGVLPVGPHRYRIEWTALNSTTDQAAFFLDGVQQAIFSLTNVGATGYYIYLSNALDSPSLNVDSIQVVPTFLTNGTYTSCALDAGSGNVWNQISWNSTIPANTSAQVEVQASSDGLTWGSWTAVSNSLGSAIPVPQRYLHYRLSLNTADSALSPLINDVTAGYQASVGPTNTPTATPTPTVTSTPTRTPTVTPLPTATPTPTSTPVPPTATNTPTNTPLPIATSTPTLAALPPTSTNTPLPPTSTNTPLPPTATSTPTNTPLAPTATGTPTNTPLPPTATGTPTNTPLAPTATNTPTNTPLPPTATNTPTNTPLPPTATGTPTNTPLPPTATSTPTNTPLAPTATSTPTNTPLAPTPTNTPLPPTPTPTPTPTASGSFPANVILDNFNRANGNLGTNWSGATRFYQVATNQLKVSSSGDIYWKTLFGVNQEVYVTLSNIIPGSTEIDLVLKSQSNSNYNKGMIEILYDPTLKVVQVWTYASPGGWIQYGADIPVTFSNGDQFGARAAVDGTVSIYRNGSLLGTRSVASWPYFNKSGYVGLWMVSAANTTMDDFGGGNY